MSIQHIYKIQKKMKEKISLKNFKIDFLVLKLLKFKQYSINFIYASNYLHYNLSILSVEPIALSKHLDNVKMKPAFSSSFLNSCSWSILVDFCLYMKFIFHYISHIYSNWMKRQCQNSSMLIHLYFKSIFKLKRNVSKSFISSFFLENDTFLQLENSYFFLA